MRPNPYSSSTIDMCGKRGFGTLFLGFLRFFEIFALRRAYRHTSCGSKGKEKALAVIRKWLPKDCKCQVLWNWLDTEHTGSDRSGARYPFAPGQEGEAQSCRAGGLSLARRYNTLDLAGKVSVPRGCGPFGNPGEEGRRRLCDRNGIVPVRGCDGAIQPVAACRGIAEKRLGRGATGVRHFLRKWYYPL